MAGWGPRLLAYGLIGLFCVPGPLGVLFALNFVVHRAAFMPVVGESIVRSSSVTVTLLTSEPAPVAAADQHERANGNAYREFELALPVELPDAERGS
jgi:hypothetical protein